MLYDIGDFNLCKYYVNHGLTHFPDWSLGKKLRQSMEVPTPEEDMKDTPETEECTQQMERLSIDIQKPTWSILVKKLSKEYHNMINR